jgi:integrase
MLDKLYKKDRLLPTVKVGGNVKHHPFRGLCQQYFARAAKKVTPSTMAKRRSITEGICIKYGDMPFDQMERKHVTSIRDIRIEAPGAANNIVKSISAMFAWAVDVGECKTNPCQGMKRLRSGDGWLAWTLEEIEQFETRHTNGTMARLALLIFMFTGLRLSDASVLGRQHFSNGWIKIRPSKTSHSSGVTVEIPVLQIFSVELSQVLNARMTLLVTEYGKPFSAKGLGNKMRQWCDEAGLPNCSAHGLRKSGASIAAENGATSDQLKAIFGRTTSQQAELNTKSARRRILAGDGAKLLSPVRNQNKNVPPFVADFAKWDNQSEIDQQNHDFETCSGGSGGTRTPNQAVMSRRL